MVTQKVLQPKKSPRLTAGKKSADPTLWADIIAMGKSLPAEVRDRIPRDAATHFDEYVSGRRKALVQTIFVDASFYIALLFSRDRLHSLAVELAVQFDERSDVRFITT